MMRRPTANRACQGRLCDHTCPRCIANVSGRTNSRGHRAYRSPPVKETLRYWERPDVQKPTKGKDSVDNGVPAKGAMMANYPHLWAMLTDDKWDDGTRRQRASLLILCDGGLFKLWLNDRDLGRSAWSTGQSPEEAFTELEEGLADDALSWRPTEQKRPEGKRIR